ncbi:MAG: hypothetical protein V2A56_07670 [bacterium]
MRSGWTAIRALATAALTSALIVGCAGSGGGRRGEPTGTPVTVRSAVENLRETPSGKQVGEVHNGQQLTQTLRRGNWAQVSGPQIPQAWIWAPSLGYPLVNPLDVHLWLGEPSAPRQISELTEIFGSQSTVETISDQAVNYVWTNDLPGGTSLFGVSSLISVKVSVDRPTRKIFAVSFVLPPFEGKTKEALSAVGLSEAKSTSINTERAQYDNRFAGVDRVELWFAEGDFLKIGEIRAWRFNPDLWQKNINVSEQKVIQDGNNLAWQMTLTNLSHGQAYASPTVEIELVYRGRSLGKWTIGPVPNTRVSPGGLVLVSLPLPVDIDGKDVKEIAGRAEILDMLVLPVN